MKLRRRFFESFIYIFMIITLVINMPTSISTWDNHPESEDVNVNQSLGSKIEQQNSETNKNNEQGKSAPTRYDKQKMDNFRSLFSSGKVTILMYHNITDGEEDYMSVHKDKFREQMKFIKDNGYNVISLDDLYAYYTEGTPIDDKSIIITFDDGYWNNYMNAYPVLKEFGFKATLFMITSMIDQKLYLNKDRLREMDANGFSIQSHTVSHLELNKMSYDQQFYELSESKKILEDILGKEIKYISFPYGQFNKDTIMITRKLNYNLAMGTVPEKAIRRNGLYNLNRIAVFGNTNIKQFEELLNKK